VRAVAVNPGGIETELVRHLSPEVKASIDVYLTKNVPQGAATSVWAGFVAPADLIGGRFCEDCNVAEITNDPQTRGVLPYAVDPQRAKALWAKAEEMVGERF